MLVAKFGELKERINIVEWFQCFKHYREQDISDEIEQSVASKVPHALMSTT